MKKLVLVLVILFIASNAFAGTYNGKSPVTSPAPVVNNYSYTTVEDDHDWFGWRSGVDIVCYENNLWKVSQTNDLESRGDLEYFVGGQVEFHLWNWLTGGKK